MKGFVIITIALLLSSLSYGQLESRPCDAGPLPNLCDENSITITTSDALSDEGSPYGTGCDLIAEEVLLYDVWFTTIVNAAGKVFINASGDGGGDDPVVAIYTGSDCTDLESIECDDDSGSDDDALATASGLTPGETVYIRVWEHGGGITDGGGYTIAASGGPPPANDNCDSPEPLVLNAAVVAGSGYCASVETPDWNDCELNTEGNVWYSFTLPSNGNVAVNITDVDCFGAGSGINVSVFTGSCILFKYLDCSTAVLATNQISFTGSGGVTYTVMVDGDNAGEANSLCNFNIDVDFAPITPECGIVGFHATNNSSPFTKISPFPSNMTCIEESIYLTADDLAKSNNYITPAIHFVFDAATDNNDNVKIYAGGTAALSSGTEIYANTLADNQELTVSEDYLDPSTSYYIEICDVNSSQPVAWQVLNGATSDSLGAGFENGGAGCRRYGPFSPRGTATWTSTAPVASFEAFDNGKMSFDPALSGPGTFEFTYEWNDGGSCTGTATKFIEVAAPYSFTSLTYPNVCAGSGVVDPNLTADPGGVFSSPTLGNLLDASDGKVTPNLVGTHTVIYTLGTGSCSRADSSTIEIIPVDSAQFTYASGTYCLTGADPSPDMGTNATLGGEFTISGAGVINSTTGEIDLSASGTAGSPYTITYNTANLGGFCSDLSTFDVAITSNTNATFSYDQATYCQNSVAPVLTYGAGASGGVFSLSPFSPSTSGLSLNTNDGSIVLTTSLSGVYTVYNTIAAAGGCSDALDSTSIEVFEVDSALFSYSPEAYCSSGTDPNANMGGNATSGGVFTISSPGVLLDSGTGKIDLDASGGGVFSVYYSTPTGNDCPAVDSVTITIYSDPVADAPSAVTACDSYTLPALSAGSNYFSATNGGGTALTAGDVIFTDSTIYVYSETGTTPNCTDENSFVVTINLSPSADAPLDETACGSYTLPALSAGSNYFSATNGGGTPLFVGDAILTTQTLYVYAETGTTPNCTTENSFVVTIISNPVADAPLDTVVCDSYTLPTLSAGNNYFSATNQGGTALTAGDVIASDSTIYIYVETGTTPNCTDENSFDVTIIASPVDDALSDVAACEFYTLSALSAGNNYYTAPNKAGTPLFAGDTILTTQTLYVYGETGTTPNCITENSFVVTIHTNPVADAPLDTVICDSYTLPALSVRNNYFTATDGGGTPLFAGDAITTTQTIYVYAETATTPSCTDENSFEVTIIASPVDDELSDVAACELYILKALSTGNNYYTGTNGGGDTLSVGDTILTTQTLYVYGETGTTPNCTTENSFVVTIHTNPVADAPSDTVMCDSYTLPALSVRNNYFTATDGGGTPLFAGDAITTTQTLYVYAETETTPSCTDESSFEVTIIASPVDDALSDVAACEFYTLSALSSGNNYYTGTNGGGTAFFAGDTILTTQTLYVYGETGTKPNCTTENSFVVTIHTNPVADAPLDTVMCDSYTLPALSVRNNYFTATDGGGTPLFAGDAIKTTQTIYVYAETETTPSCTDENSFEVKIIPSPVDDALSDVGACEIYILSALSAGNNYYTAPNKEGTAIFAGDAIITTQTVYVYGETGTTPNCITENSFVVTIHANPVADAPGAETACDSYTLPALNAENNYFTATDGGGTPLFAGDVITTTQTIYVYAETATTPSCTDENSFEVTIIASPVDDGLSDLAACESYILLVLSAGNNYYTAPNKAGTAFFAGDTILTTQTLYVYGETGTTPNCTTEYSFVVTIHANPVADAPGAETACDSYTLPALSAGNNYFTASDGEGTPLFAGDAITTTQTIYVYTETATTPSCTDENSFVVTIDPQLSISVNPDETFCLVENITLSATASGFGTVTWYTDVLGVTSVGTGNPLVISSPGNGVYTYYAKEVGGSCPSKMDSVEISIGGVEAVIDANPPTGGNPLYVTFDGSGSSGTITAYSWDFGNGSIGLDSITNSIYDDIGIYTTVLIVTDGICNDTATIEIDVFGISTLVIPYLFTPNGDGQNDFFTVGGTNLVSVECQIFNRWGQKVFSWNHLKGYWDGRTLAGSVAPDGTYFYMIKAVGVDGQEYFKKGSVSLVN
jgi:gliding motility-associated-like protein